MKKIYCFIASFIAFANVSAQELTITKVNSDAASRDFVIQENYDKDNAPQWNHFYLSDGNEWQDYYNLNKAQQDFVHEFLNSKPWAKADINGDGKPDLIVSGYIARSPKDWTTATFKLLVFLTGKGDSYVQLNLVDDRLDKLPAYFNIITLDGKPYLRLFRWKNDTGKDNEIPLHADTLKYSNTLGYFVKYGAYLNPDDIGRVEYVVQENNAGAYHALFIANQDGKAFPINIAIMRQGYKTPAQYHAALTKNLWSEVDTLMRRFQFKSDSIVYDDDVHSLKEKLPIKLTLYFKDGSKKTITDYNADESYTLMTLYQIFEDIINNTLDLYSQRQEEAQMTDDMD